jgi:hypothetical protein
VQEPNSVQFIFNLVQRGGSKKYQHIFNNNFTFYLTCICKFKKDTSEAKKQKHYYQLTFKIRVGILN